MTHADLKAASDPAAVNELVIDARGNAYVNGGGFDLMAGEPFAPGIVAFATPDGSARTVAAGLGFPNGMLIMPDDRTLIVAESYAKRLTAFDIDADGGLSNRRVWADLGEGVPDGICADAENAVWYADVPKLTSGACASAKAARCCKRSSLIAPALRAPSVGRMERRCSWSQTNGEARPTCSKGATHKS